MTSQDARMTDTQMLGEDTPEWFSSELAIPQNTITSLHFLKQSRTPYSADAELSSTLRRMELHFFDCEVRKNYGRLLEHFEHLHANLSKGTDEIMAHTVDEASRALHKGYRHYTWEQLDGVVPGLDEIVGKLSTSNQSHRRIAALGELRVRVILEPTSELIRLRDCLIIPVMDACQRILMFLQDWMVVVPQAGFKSFQGYNEAYLGTLERMSLRCAGKYKDEVEKLSAAATAWQEESDDRSNTRRALVDEFLRDWQGMDVGSNYDFPVEYDEYLTQKSQQEWDQLFSPETAKPVEDQARFRARLDKLRRLMECSWLRRCTVLVHAADRWAEGAVNNL